MTTPISTESLQRYAALCRALLPQAVSFCLCDANGKSMVVVDSALASETQEAIDELHDSHPNWPEAKRMRTYALASMQRWLLAIKIDDVQGETAAFLVMLAEGNVPDQPVYLSIAPVAACIAHEISLSTELDTMTVELTERYEELNLVYNTEDQVNIFRESEKALQNLTQNCLDYLDVGLSALILKGKGVATSCHHPSEPISNGQAVAAELSERLYQWVQEHKEVVVINDMLDDLALRLLPGLPYRVLCCPVLDASGAVTGILATVNCYSKPKFSNSDKNLLQVISRKAAKIVDANYDSLTGLVNRNGYEDYLDAAFVRVREAETEQCLLHINIDKMHIINDTVSFAAGDYVIRRVAGIVEARKREGDTLSRIGGDEFGLMLDDCSFSAAIDLAERVCREVEKTEIVFNDEIFKVTVSVGVAMLTAASESVAQVMGVAEVACSMAKESGRNRVETYRPDNLDIVRREEQMHLVAHIQNALADDQFVLFCQPIVSLRAESVAHHTEVLLRIIGDGGEILAPGNFIPAAERYHLMPAIDRWVVAKTLSMLSGYDNKFLTTGVFSVNLSGQSFNEKNFLEFVIREIEKSGVPPQCLCFEITETAAVASLGKAIEFIECLKAVGCSFSLDDFGSGISSFGYLKSLPVDYLKIDGGIVKDITTDETSAAMVAAINQVGHTMKLLTIAEYVEDNEIRDLLQDIGVDYAQGYGIGKPAPFADRLRALLESPVAVAS